MRRARPIALALAACALIGAAPERPERIVSLNLCADQYLIALAEPGQIAAVTQFARDPAMSAAARAATRFATTRGTAEEVLVLDPDLIFVSPGARVEAVTARAGRHYRTIELPAANSYAEIVAQIRTVARAIGHPARGEALIRHMDAQLAALPKNGRNRVAAYYQRRGYLTGKGTLVDELMARAGLVNLATRLGKPALSRVSIEEMVAARPDWLIVETATDRVTDLGTEMLHHPALAAIARLRLPEAWTVCGGPAYVQAAQSLARQLAAR